MVIDDKRKVIFVHIPKCGGISVERSIHKALGGNDIFNIGKIIKIPKRSHVKSCKGLGLHSTMKDYRRYYEGRFPEFYKFSIVRNPWRRMVSHYEYLVFPGWNKKVDENNRMKFSDFVQVYKSDMLGYSMKYGYEIFLDDKRGTLLDRVIKLENINEDLLSVGSDIGLEINEVLHMNSTPKKHKIHENWKDYYNPGLRDRVYKIYKDDIEKYNYEFEE